MWRKNMEKPTIENDDEKKNERRLTDIALVAYLVCEGFKMMKIVRRKDKSDFFFEESANIEQATLNFFNHEAKVDTLKFNETLRNLRSYAKQG